jgi:hypothetical protein
MGSKSLACRPADRTEPAPLPVTHKSPHTTAPQLLCTRQPAGQNDQIKDIVSALISQTVGNKFDATRGRNLQRANRGNCNLYIGPPQDINNRYRL